MSVTRKKKPAKAAPKPYVRPEPSPALKAQFEASIKEHSFITAKVRGHLKACEHQVISDLSQQIERALWPVSNWFIEDFKGIAGGLALLRRSLSDEKQLALVDFCIRSLDQKAQVITAARDDALSATQVALHPEWQALPEALERAAV